MTFDSYLRLLPKAELHCHFVSVMRPATLIELAATHGVQLPSDDVEGLLDFDNLQDFLDVFNAAHAVLATPEDFARVAYEGVQDAIAAGNLRYREYFINPQNFAMPYEQLVDAIADGLQSAERDYGVGFRLVIAINRSHSPESAVQLVNTVSSHPREFVVGLGMDDLTPEGTEDPIRFTAAYELARKAGLKVSAHVGETMPASPDNVALAIDVLKVDRIDHGYRIMDDAALVSRVRELGMPFTCTPVSTRVLSQWEFTPDHRIAQMVRAGLTVTFATDDAVFFSTDIGREYREAIPAMGLDRMDAARIARAGFESAWCSDLQKQRLLADFDAQLLALNAAFPAGSIGS